MVANPKIAWTTHTFNPWIGCQKVSPGCDNCYAETLMDKRLGKVEWGPHGQRVRTSESNWRKPLQWDKAAKAEGVRPRVFCASLADWLDNKVPEQWRIDLCRLIDQTPNMDWLLLTKRIENFRNLSTYWQAGSVPSNVWLGITAEDQATYDRRWPILQSINAPVHFISHEPAIGQITDLRIKPDMLKPSWIIMGGESGANPRMMEPVWARNMMLMCKANGIPFFMKQMTDLQPIPGDLFVREFPR